MKKFLASVLLHGHPLPFESIEGVLARTGGRAARPAPATAVGPNPPGRRRRD